MLLLFMRLTMLCNEGRMLYNIKVQSLKWNLTWKTRAHGNLKFYTTFHLCYLRYNILISERGSRSKVEKWNLRRNTSFQQIRKSVTCSQLTLVLISPLRGKKIRYKLNIWSNIWRIILQNNTLHMTMKKKLFIKPKKLGSQTWRIFIG